MNPIELTYCLNNRLLDKDGNIVKLKQGTKITLQQSDLAVEPHKDFLIRPRFQQYTDVENTKYGKKQNPYCFVLPRGTKLFFEIKTPLFGKSSKTRFYCELLEDLYAAIKKNQNSIGCQLDECACCITGFDIYETSSYADTTCDKYKPFYDKYLKVAQKIEASSLSSLYTKTFITFREDEIANVARANTTFFCNGDKELLGEIKRIIASDTFIFGDQMPEFGIPIDVFKEKELKYRSLNKIKALKSKTQAKMRQMGGETSN